MLCETFFLLISFQQTWMRKILAHNQFHFNGFTFSLKNFFHIHSIHVQVFCFILLFLCALHYIIINNIAGCIFLEYVFMNGEMRCVLWLVNKKKVFRFSFISFRMRVSCGKYWILNILSISMSIRAVSYVDVWFIGGWVCLIDLNF